MSLPDRGSTDIPHFRPQPEAGASRPPQRPAALPPVAGFAEKSSHLPSQPLVDTTFIEPSQGQHPAAPLAVRETSAAASRDDATSSNTSPAPDAFPAETSQVSQKDIYKRGEGQATVNDASRRAIPASSTPEPDDRITERISDTPQPSERTPFEHGMFDVYSRSQDASTESTQREEQVLDAVVQLRREWDTESGVLDDYTDVDRREYFRHDIAEKNAAIVSVQDNTTGETVGFIELTEDLGEAELSQAVVTSRYRERGVFGQLVDRSLELAVERGYESIVAYPSTDGRAARVLQSKGFEVEDVDGAGEITLRKDLRSSQSETFPEPGNRAIPASSDNRRDEVRANIPSPSEPTSNVRIETLPGGTVVAVNTTHPNPELVAPLLARIDAGDVPDRLIPYTPEYPHPDKRYYTDSDTNPTLFVAHTIREREIAAGRDAPLTGPEEIELTPEIRDILATNNVIEMVRELGFRGISLIEPLASFTDAQGNSVKVYPFDKSYQAAGIDSSRRPPPGSELERLDTVIVRLANIFEIYGIEAHDLSSGQARLVADPDGAIRIHLTDLEDYRIRETRNVATQLQTRYPEQAQLYAEHINGPLSDISHEFPLEVRDRLLAGETRVDENILSQLQEFSDEAHTHPSEFVAQARTELQQFLTDGPLPNADQFLREKGVSLILYGSLQYGDPRNVDVDLLAVMNERPTEEETAEIESVLNRLGDALEEYWPNLSEFQGRTRGTPAFGHVTYYLSDFADVETFLEETATEYPARSPLDLSPIISGVPLFAQDQPAVTALQQRAREIAELDPLLNAVTNVDLASVLQERIQRRAISTTSSSESEAQLSQRQLATKRLMAQGYNTQQIADELSISRRTASREMKAVSDAEGTTGQQRRTHEEKARLDRAIMDALIVGGRSRTEMRQAIERELGAQISRGYFSQIEAKLRAAGLLEDVERASIGRQLDTVTRNIIFDFTITGLSYNEVRDRYATTFTREQFSNKIGDLRARGYDLPYGDWGRQPGGES